MKITAHGRYMVVLEATPQEVNLLAGKELYQWSSYNDRWNREPSPGTTFDIVAGITQLHRNAQRVEEVKRLKVQLQSIIVQLDLVEPFMKEPEPAPPQECTEEHA